MFNIPTIDDRN